ncbi:cation:proton antiporter [Ferrimonas marina]|uniref:Multicomponent Na+:H+ antiporter subunit F n=1 Tax=Ferrimonas marina TaxID=299255 RepID=A0A1M5Z5V7_9GAMM|nr:cation:proton antiporter [Ferrimonas marina]SHI19273.1 multicomponent Na+:H+ antiporter subunit F [Ferrimonas marina]
MTEFLALAITFAYTGLLLSFTLALVRLVKGPTLADRVVALDMIAFLTIGFIAVYTLDSGQESFLDVAITLALVAFLGTIAFARFIAKSDEEPRA